MVKFRFNKMVKSLSISQGKTFIGIIDLEPFKEFINSDIRVKAFEQVDGRGKNVVVSKMSFDRLRITKGNTCYGYISFKDFKEYFNNDILDIKEFEKLILN